jgi:hypothetical protein
MIFKSVYPGAVESNDMDSMAVSSGFRPSAEMSMSLLTFTGSN